MVLRLTARKEWWDEESLRQCTGLCGIFQLRPEGHFDLYEKAIDGAGPERLAFESKVGKYCESWPPDGKFLL
jgi:hypothetical protein